MPEDQSSLTIILLSGSLVLGLWILLILFRISARLRRLESLVGQSRISAEAQDVVRESSDASTGGAFENFLNEDPSRRALTKAEQFAAYRQWRQEKGLNWSNTPDIS